MREIFVTYTVLKTIEVDEIFTEEEIQHLLELEAPEYTNDIEWEFIEE